MFTLKLRRIRKALFVAAMLGAGPFAAAQDEYDFIFVDDFIGSYGLGECYLYDINDVNVACGTATIRIGSTTTYTGFYWAPPNDKTPVQLSWPKGINDLGQMAGVRQIYDIPTGQFTDMSLLPGTYFPLVLADINDGGTAVGYVQTCNCSNSQGFLQIPYVWDASQGARSLPVPGANGAARINRHGLVVGWIGGWSASDGYVFDLNTGTYTIMSSRFAGTNTQTTAVDVNDNGVVVGARKNSNGTIVQAYTWSAQAGVNLLPLPPAGFQPYVRPAGINDRGAVVGAIYTPLASSRAFVYDDPHGIRDLNALTTPPPGFVLMTATAVNDNGWIVGYGYGGVTGMYKSFVLKPRQRLGDMNCDGSINPFDIQGFMVALSDPSDYERQYPDCNLLNADTNSDGSVNAFDIQGFVDLLTP